MQDQDDSIECEKEMQHIYRIIMANNVVITDLDEAKLEQFINFELESGVKFLAPDRDGIEYVDLDQDVAIYPCAKRGFMTYPLEDKSFTMKATDAKKMVAQLARMGRLDLLNATMQGLAQRQDGVKLQTAFPLVSEVKLVVKSGLELPVELIKKMDEWGEDVELNFDFVEI
ncbi:MAG: hypothetical protein IBX55_00620 [Methyloprofundus sp.]|nr:hypothetical protein [Methyloprofundus sp.]